MLRYLSLDIICSSKLTVFLELRSRKTVRFSEQITSADKYLSIFSRQMEAIVYIYIYLAKPKSGAPQLLFNRSYRRPGPVNNMYAYFFCFYLFIYLFFFYFLFFFTFYHDRGEPFCGTVYAHYVALSLSN